MELIVSYSNALDAFLVIIQYIPWSVRALLYLSLGLSLGVGFMKFLLRL